MEAGEQNVQRGSSKVTYQWGHHRVTRGAAQVYYLAKQSGSCLELTYIAYYYTSNVKTFSGSSLAEEDKKSIRVQAHIW